MLLREIVTLKGKNMTVDLIIFDMFDFNVISVMDFLRQYRIKIDCKKKKVKFHLDDGKEFTFGKGQVHSLMINNIKAMKLLSKGCRAYFAHVFGKDNDLVLSL